MSLHAQISPEAEARLRAQKRTSTITSFIIALLGMALVGILLLLISLTLLPKEIPTIVGYTTHLPPDKSHTKPTVPTTVQRQTSAPKSTQTRVIIANMASATAVPVPDTAVPERSTTFGDGDDFGSGGPGAGPGSPPGFIEPSMQKRCSKQDRLSRLTESGGNAACEDAVVKGLQFLAKTQNKDGSWGTEKPVAMTGLALLAYLGHCETTQSPEFGINVLNGIVYLTDVAQKQDGKLATDLKDNHWCYEHAIALYALSEAYSLCTKSFGENIPLLENSVTAAGQFLLDNQHQSGAWEYSYQTDNSRGGDTSIAGWHMQAMKAMKVTHLEFNGIPKASRAGLGYFEKCQDADGAIGYTNSKGTQEGNRDGTTLAAVGALSYQMWEKGSDSVARKACKFIDEKMAFDWNGPTADLYGHYYAAQAMINYGGDYWQRYNAKFRDQVLDNQAADGSWKDVGPVKAPGAQYKGNGKESVHYRTCLSTLMLETYYRFLPASN